VRSERRSSTRHERIHAHIPILAVLALCVASASVVGAGEPVARVKFEIQNNRIIFPMKVGDSRELSILLDSGATLQGVYLFHEELIEELGLSDGTEQRVAGAGSGEASRTVMKEGATLHAGGVEFHDQQVFVSRSPQTQRFPRDGVAGYTLFGSYVVEIDYDSMTLALHDPDGFEPDSSWESLEMTLRPRIPWIEISVVVAGEKEIPASVYIDLAAGDALLLLVKPEMKFELPEGLEQRYIGTGLSGDIHGGIGRVRSVKIGPYRLENVVTAFPPAEVRSKQEGADGIIGNDLMRRFNVIFDYGNERLYLKPNRHFETPFELESATAPVNR